MTLTAEPSMIAAPADGRAPVARRPLDRAPMANEGRAGEGCVWNHCRGAVASEDGPRPSSDVTTDTRRAWTRS
jgi:hypothetical protein